jgi:hypothetical protein
MTRAALPNKRQGESFAIEHVGLRFRLQVNEYPDGRIGEVFLNWEKSDTAVDALGGDFAILISLLLQHGMTAAQIGHALRRNSRGEPQTIAGTVVDFVAALDATFVATEALRTDDEAAP